MASNYWLKLYHEMLDDPKVMTLRPALRWRFVECLLVAGELDEGGLLPATDHYAWRVRSSPEIVETELAELADAGLLSRENGKWLVTKFAERQSADTAAERMRRMRERNRKQEYYQNETESLHEGDEPVTKRNTDKIREEKDTDPRAGEVYTAYENEIGNLTPIISEKIGSAIDVCGPEWVLDAIAIAAENEARTWSYVRAILKRWKKEGRDSKTKKPHEKAVEAWALVKQAWDKRQYEPLRQRPDILETLEKIGYKGSTLKDANASQAVWIEKRFIEAYNAAN